jgi:hypothetical protein
LGAALTAAVAGDVIPLTSDHWRDAPSIVLEHETGIPAAVIEDQRRQDREREPYPSIPGAAGPRQVPPTQQEAPAEGRPLPRR